MVPRKGPLSSGDGDKGTGGARPLPLLPSGSPGDADRRASGNQGSGGRRCQEARWPPGAAAVGRWPPGQWAARTRGVSSWRGASVLSRPERPLPEMGWKPHHLRSVLVKFK